MRAREIVRKLADSIVTAETGEMYHECMLCNAGLPIDVEDHAPDCPWRLAVEWVAEHKDDKKKSKASDEEG